MGSWLWCAGWVKVGLSFDLWKSLARQTESIPLATHVFLPMSFYHLGDHGIFCPSVWLYFSSTLVASTKSSVRFVCVCVCAARCIWTIILVITLKGAIWDFLHSPHHAANSTRELWWLGAIVCKLPAAHRMLNTCNVSCATWYEGTAQLLS